MNYKWLKSMSAKWTNFISYLKTWYTSLHGTPDGAPDCIPDGPDGTPDGIPDSTSDGTLMASLTAVLMAPLMAPLMTILMVPLMAPLMAFLILTLIHITRSDRSALCICDELLSLHSCTNKSAKNYSFTLKMTKMNFEVFFISWINEKANMIIYLWFL